MDEHDHPEQAEFIRRHIEYARTAEKEPDRLARYIALENFWNRFKVRLLEALPATEARLDGYSRGMPEHRYYTTAARFLADSADWWPLFPVRRLLLDGWVERVHEVCQCSYLERVTHLTLQLADVDLHTARALVVSPYLTNVRQLWLFPQTLPRAAGQLLRRHFGDRLYPIS